MIDLMVGMICIETTDAYMKVGPFIIPDGEVSNTFIKNKIHESFIENDCDYYTADDIENLALIALCDEFEMVLSPKIEDVWPRDFGPKGFKRYVTKRGDK